MARSGVCRLCSWVRPKRNRICQGDFVEPKLLFVRGGHFVLEYALEEMPRAQPWLKWRLWTEARKLYTSRVRVAQSLGKSISTRIQEGKSVDHIRLSLAYNRRAVRAHTRALDSAGMLGAVERIINSKGFKKEYESQSGH